MSKSRCGCVYADAKNTASVRLGYEMGGYLKEPCAKHDRMTQPMSSEMRECPFCGNQPRSGWQGTGVPGMDDCGYWGIDCCNAFAHADTEAEALAQWNRRSDAPNGSWLWCKLMDFCQKRRFPPAEFNDLFAIVTEAHELNNRALLARTEAGADGAVAWQRGSALKGWRGEQWQECTKEEHDSIKSLGYWTDASGFNWPSVTRELYSSPAHTSEARDAAVMKLLDERIAAETNKTRRWALICFRDAAMRQEGGNG